MPTPPAADEPLLRRDLWLFAHELGKSIDAKVDRERADRTTAVVELRAELTRRLDAVRWQRDVIMLATGSLVKAAWDALSGG